MGRHRSTQLNIRSRFARERVAVLACETGMIAAQVIDDALRACPPPPADEVPPGLVRKGPLLVVPANGAPTLTLEDANAALDEARSGVR